MGKIIINKSIEYIKKYYSLTKRIIAEIKPQNIASIKIFQSCNFKYIGKKNCCDLDMLIYHYDIERILILAAHPDDETLGCGATIKRLSKNPHTYIKLITFSDGESSRDNSNGFNRNLVLNNVCKKLGIDEHISGNFPDNKMDTVPLLELAKFIENNVNFTPNIIFKRFEGPFQDVLGNFFQDFL